MMRRSTAYLLKVVVALAVTAGMLLSAIHVSTSHNPVVLAQAEAERHAELATDVTDHGHSHFDGEEAEQIPGHLHGHNSADHIHDAAAILPTSTLRLPTPIRVTRPAFQENTEPSLRHGLDRPPRQFVA